MNAPTTRPARACRSWRVVFCASVWLLAGCSREIDREALVVTQVPLTNAAPRDALEERYPLGTRIVLLTSKRRVLLSEGLASAAEPVLRPDGRAVVFTGKRTANAEWQLFEVALPSGSPRQLTSAAGGAMNPANLGNGDIVFSSPVPKPRATWTAAPPSALFVQPRAGTPRRITFGAGAAVQPTLLRDGRILFVSSRAVPAGAPRLGLFTVNSDGTEPSAFAVNEDGAPFISRPRELGDGRIAFIASATENGRESWVEVVRTARPFSSRVKLPGVGLASVSAIEGGRSLIVAGRRDVAAPFEMFSVAGTALVTRGSDRAWHDYEAIPTTVPPRAAGHLSTMVAARKTGTLLCLNATFGRPGIDALTARTQRVRVLAGAGAEAIGEVALERDGSFLVEVPADTPLGFEGLDAEGRSTVRLAPTFWVRPGENRSCVGCHEPYHHSPPNGRPIAATKPPVKLTVLPRLLAEQRPRQ